MPADGANRECLQPVQRQRAHHDQEVGRHDVVVAVGCVYGNGVGVQPCPRVRFAIELLDADRLARNMLEKVEKPSRS